MRIDPGVLAALGLLSAAAAAVLTVVALRYAQWRRMLDLPGRRRMHAHATPRGGGIGIVLVTAVAGLVGLPMPLGASFSGGLALVAGIGWIDDHRPLSAKLRLVVHLLAAFAFVSALWPLQALASVQHGVLFGVAVLGLAAAVNFWNFMDGSNGLVTSQTAWVATLLALAFGIAGAGPFAAVAVALAGACLGFLPFNFPRARIFLGDVGSGGLGFACAALWLLAVDLDREAFWWLVLLPAVLLVDASLTLLQRIALGRRWYTAHREHLYQWLIRSGRSHGNIVGLYLAWNGAVLLPAMLAALVWPRWAPAVVSLALAVTVLAWVIGKRAVLHRVRNGTSQ